ncbi:MAG TPA: substrate-binding domain-containing protein, partial [Sphingomonadales bacterium]|nr:substrate-binding domain-containing protein [Sphingomonadales bacterium]
LLAGSAEEIARNRLVFTTAAPEELAAAREGAGYFAGGKLVTGDPASTALGRAAREALINLGFPDNVESAIVPAPSAAEAVAMLRAGAALEGILYRSDALAAGDVAILDEIPDTMHAPIAYLAAPIAAGNAGQASFLLDFLKSEAFKTILIDKGFDLPPEGEPIMSNE